MTSKKLLKLINMHEINESGCQVLHEEIQKYYFFFSWILLPPKAKQNSWIWSWLCSTVPRNRTLSSKGDWDVVEVDATYCSSYRSNTCSAVTFVVCGQQLKQGHQ